MSKKIQNVFLILITGTIITTLAFIAGKSNGDQGRYDEGFKHGYELGQSDQRIDTSSLKLEFVKKLVRDSEFGFEINGTTFTYTQLGGPLENEANSK